ncbi:MAG: CotH kinase family protein [Pseudomonadota bacterium]
MKLCLLLLLVGCHPPDDSGLGPQDTGGPEPGGACEESVQQCPMGQGCHDEVCGACEEASECHDLEGCHDGACGACIDATDCRDGEACREGYCLPEAPPVWQLTLDPVSLAEMEAHPQEDIWAPCTLEAGGTLYTEELQVRLYGGTTRSYPKRSFMIEFPEDADNPGFSRKITLRAEYNDASFLRTVLGYESFRRLTSLPTPRTRYIDLFLNGERYGLMVDVERMRGRFLEERGRDREAAMYEAYDDDKQGAMTPNGTLEEYREFYERQTGDESDYTDLAALIEDHLALDWQASLVDEGAALDRTSQVVRLSAYRRYLAVMAALQNQDHVTNNFMFSWQSVGGEPAAWEVYPLDLDLTFGCLWDADAQDTICDSYRADGWWLNGLYPDGAVVGVDEVWANLLIHLTLTQPDSLAAYEDELCAVLASDFWNGGLQALALAIRQTVAPVVAVDINDRSATEADYIAAWEEVAGFPAERRDYLEEALGCSAR